MDAWLLAHEPALRLGVALGLFALMAGWELLAPRRALRLGRWPRWAFNLGMILLNTILLRVFLPTAAVGFAAIGAERGWGLLHAQPGWLAIPASLLLFDLAIWTQHLVFHRVPWLWRLHRVHHADLDYDVTLGTRFHPIEIGLSMLIKLALIRLLGPPASAVLLFELILHGMSTFNHGNVAMPAALDAALRWLLVTPDYHRVHHSVIPREHHSNFGFNLSIWDRIFGTYVAEPAAGQLGATFGLPDQQGATRQGILWMLIAPFKPISST